MRGNEAVEINSADTVDFHLTEHGSDWLWAAFSLFALCTVVSVGLSFTKPKAERLFYHMTSFSLLIMSIAYFTMASNLGWAGVRAEFNHVTTSTQEEHPGLRQVFYTRFVAWFLAFPGFFLNFATLSSLDWSTALFTIVCQEVTVIGLLVGAVVSSSYKWGYFTFAAFAYLLVAFNLLFPFRRASYNVNSKSVGNILFPSVVVLLLLYPICWALSEGGNVIQLDSEAAFYGVLDVCFFLVAGGYFLYAARGVDFLERGIAGCESAVFTKGSYNYNKPLASAAATKEANLERHSGETAADHVPASQEAAQQNAQQTV